MQVLRRVFINSNITQTELAELSGVSPSLVSRALSGDKTVSYTSLCKIANGLDFKGAPELLMRDESELPKPSKTASDKPTGDEIRALLESLKDAEDELKAAQHKVDDIRRRVDSALDRL